MSLRFITGKVRSGKTSVIISEIRDTVRNGSGKALLLVPEQYSHEAERELCEACGDRLSLFAEVMSFSGFARWSMGVHGGGAEVRMDQGGKLLCMALALRELQPLLKVYGRAADNNDLQTMMVREAERLRAADCDTDMIRTVSESLVGELREKLKEFALIMDAYRTEIERAGAVAEDAIQLLARQIELYGLPEFDRVYVDGFIDFTGLETHVLRALLRRGVDLTVCLPLEEKNRGEEFFLPSRIAMDTLEEIAASTGTDVRVQRVDALSREGTLAYFTDHMFDYGVAAAEPEKGRIRLINADNPRMECEFAAAEILRTVREEGWRWRDIAVAVRGFDEYRDILESTFRRYGIPLFITRRDTLAEKPLPMWIEAAYDIVLGDWDSEDVTAYLQSGICELDEDSCDELCRYLFKWQLKAGAWLRAEPWHQHPDGYGKPWTEDAQKRLERINRARRKIAGPLLNLREHAAKAKTAYEQAEALNAFLKETHAATLLEKRVRKLEEQGSLELRDEYSQLWELCLGALNQIAAVLGDTQLDASGFSEMFHTVLAQYDIGLIPVALDRVSAGDFDRMRRRNIRELIVLGCGDDRLPQARGGDGIFNTEERDILAAHRVMIGGGEAELWREYALIYHTLSLPHERLILSCPSTGFRGELVVPSLVYTQVQRMFSLQPETVKRDKLRLSARVPALSLALSAGRPGTGGEALAAAAWFEKTEPLRVTKLLQDSVIRHENLSPHAVAALYGSRIRISPSRLERFSACRYSYYCSFGLKAEEDEPAGFRAPEIGTFVHSVLEQTAREVAERGGFRTVSDNELQEITRAVVSDYIHTELADFREKSARFRHLFERVCEDVFRIVADTAEELRKSDFEPLSFELDISKLPSASSEEGLDQGEEPSLTGIADRVDGWIHEDSLWLRVVDYKTGRKKFSLSDVWYGRNMQMLLYLFAVSDRAEALYGRPGIPAGILYLPAREELLHFDRQPDDEQTARQRMKGKRRSGLVLDDPALIEAWEQGSEKQYIPVRVPSANPLVNLEQMGMLRRHVEKSLREMADEIRAGSIRVSPSYVSESENACRLCPFHSICRFEEGENGEFSCPTPKLTDEKVWEQLKEEV